MGLFAEGSEEVGGRNAVDVARSVRGDEAELVKGVQAQSEFLGVAELRLHFFAGAEVPQLQRENVPTLRVDLAQRCPFSRLNCFVVLDVRDFLLLHHALHAHLRESGCEFVDARIGGDWEAVLQFEEFVAFVDVGLFEGNLSDSVDDLDVVNDFREGKFDGLRLFLIEREC